MLPITNPSLEPEAVDSTSLSGGEAIINPPLEENSSAEPESGDTSLEIVNPPLDLTADSPESEEGGLSNPPLDEAEESGAEIGNSPL